MDIAASLPCLIRVMTMKNNYAGPESKTKFNSTYDILVCMSNDIFQNYFCSRCCQISF